jgi:hypothetical protein
MYNKIGIQNYMWQETTAVFEIVSEQERVIDITTLQTRVLSFIAARK